MWNTRLICAFACLSLFAGPVYSAISPAAEVESHLNGGTILSVPAAKLPPAVLASVSEHERKAPAYVYAVLAGGRADANAIAPWVVAAAIKGLSKPPSNLLIAEIIEAAVKTTPDAVLKIVKAAVTVSPEDAAPAIVRAAMASVQYPEEWVAAKSGSTMDYKGVKGFKDFKGFRDYKGGREPGSNLPEEIVRAAREANPNLDPAILADAVNQGRQIQISTPVDNDSNPIIWPPDVPFVSR